MLWSPGVAWTGAGEDSVEAGSTRLEDQHVSGQLFMPPPFEEWWMGIKCYPCPCNASVRPLSKFGVCSITFERLHRFNSNVVCWYIISKHRLSSIWVTIQMSNVHNVHCLQSKGVNYVCNEILEKLHFVILKVTCLQTLTCSWSSRF